MKVLSYSPLLLVKVWVHVVVPSFTALLARSAPDLVVLLEHLGYEGPSLGAILGYQAYDGVIFLFKITVNQLNLNSNSISIKPKILNSKI